MKATQVKNKIIKKNPRQVKMIIKETQNKLKKKEKERKKEIITSDYLAKKKKNVPCTST